MKRRPVTIIVAKATQSGATGFSRKAKMEIRSSCLKHLPAATTVQQLKKRQLTITVYNPM